MCGEMCGTGGGEKVGARPQIPLVSEVFTLDSAHAWWVPQNTKERKLIPTIGLCVFLSLDGSSRSIQMDSSFFKGYRKTAVLPSEILISVLIPFSSKVCFHDIKKQMCINICFYLYECLHTYMLFFFFLIMNHIYRLTNPARIEQNLWIMYSQQCKIFFLSSNLLGLCFYSNPTTKQSLSRVSTSAVTSNLPGKRMTSQLWTVVWESSLTTRGGSLTLPLLSGAWHRSLSWQLAQWSSWLARELMSIVV